MDTLTKTVARFYLPFLFLCLAFFIYEPGGIAGIDAFFLPFGQVWVGLTGLA